MTKQYIAKTPNKFSVEFDCGCSFSATSSTEWECSQLCEDHDPSIRKISSWRMPEEDSDFETNEFGYVHILELIGDPVQTDDGLEFEAKFKFEDEDDEEVIQDTFGVAWDEKEYVQFG